MSPAEEPENKFCGEKNLKALSMSCLYELFQEKENGDIHDAPCAVTFRTVDNVDSG